MRASPKLKGNSTLGKTTACVAMCTYNGARYLQEQLNSIAAQTQLPDRMVIVDDCSSDQTVAIAASFAAQMPFPVHVEVNTRNVGFAKNFERAICLSQGEVIVLSDQDDVWHPSKLSKISALFRQFPAVGFAFSDAEAVTEDLRPLGYRLWDAVGFSELKQTQVEAGEAFELLLVWGNVVTGATMAFRSSFKDLVLPFGGGLHDAWIALLVSAVAEVKPIAEPLVKYRQHAANQIGAKRTGLIGRIIDAKPPEAQDLERLSLALERLEERASVSPERVALLRASIDHLATRISLPDRRVLRLGTVCRHLLNGRYHRLSNGLSTAVKDLVTRH